MDHAVYSRRQAGLCSGHSRLGRCHICAARRLPLFSHRPRHGRFVDVSDFSCSSGDGRLKLTRIGSLLLCSPFMLSLRTVDCPNMTNTPALSTSRHISSTTIWTLHIRMRPIRADPQTEVRWANENRWDRHASASDLSQTQPSLSRLNNDQDAIATNETRSSTNMSVAEPLEATNPARPHPALPLWLLWTIHWLLWALFILGQEGRACHSSPPATTSWSLCRKKMARHHRAITSPANRWDWRGDDCGASQITGLRASFMTETSKMRRLH